MKNKIMTVAGAMALTAALAGFNAQPIHAQRPALVQDADQPARAPFQVTVAVNINNFVYTPVTIPTGKRLVIDYISMSGAAGTAGAYVQPIIILSSTVSGNPSALYYFGPPPSATVPGQYYHTEAVKIYSDTLSVAPAFAGYTPTVMSFSVVISGHLVSIP